MFCLCPMFFIIFNSFHKNNNVTCFNPYIGLSSLSTAEPKELCSIPCGTSMKISAILKFSLQECAFSIIYSCHPDCQQNKYKHIIIVESFIIGAAVDVRLKCFPETCLNPLAFSQPWYVPFLFFLHAHIDVMTFAPSS